MRKNTENTTHEDSLETVAELLAAAMLRRRNRLDSAEKEKNAHVRQHGLDSSPHTKRSWNNPGREREKTTAGKER